MGDPKGPAYGWSPVLPTVQGWYEIASEKTLDVPEKERENPVRLWTDGSGGFWSPTLVPILQAHEMKLPRRSVIARYRDGKDIGNAVGATHWLVLLPVYGSFRNTYFRALGPLLHRSLPARPVVELLKPYQEPSSYLNEAQKREAAIIDEERPEEES